MPCHPSPLRLHHNGCYGHQKYKKVRPLFKNRGKNRQENSIYLRHETDVEKNQDELSGIFNPGRKPGQEKFDSKPKYF